MPAVPDARHRAAFPRLQATPHPRDVGPGRIPRGAGGNRESNVWERWFRDTDVNGKDGYKTDAGRYRPCVDNVKRLPVVTEPKVRLQASS